MNERRFDDLAKAVASGSTRRHFIASLLLGVGALFGRTSGQNSTKAQSDCGMFEDSCFDGCTDTYSDPFNCGSCGYRCFSGETCQSGRCRISGNTQYECGPFLEFCDGGCVATNSDPYNCGFCGNVCPLGLSCDSGQCSCGPFLEHCGGGCVATNSDQYNCGFCGNVCSPNEFCNSGYCEDHVLPASTARSVDTREAYLRITPELSRVVPGGSVLFFVQPVFWGNWGDRLPDYTVELLFPSGMNLLDETVCGPWQATVPDRSSCQVDVRADSGGTRITAYPGSVGLNTMGLFTLVGIDSDVAVKTSLLIDVSLLVIGNVPDSIEDQRAVHVVVIEPSELSPQVEEGVVSGVIEIHSRVNEQNGTCSTDSISEGTELAIYGWGESDMLASTMLSAGRQGNASDGMGYETCIFDFRFENVALFDIYSVAFKPADGDIPCRACYLGLVTSSENAQQVIIVNNDLPS